MKEKENLSEEIKLRVSKSQKNAIEQLAQNKNSTISIILRNIVFPQGVPISSYMTQIYRIMIKFEFYNKIQAMEIPSKYKSQIIKELENIDNGNF